MGGAQVEILLEVIETSQGDGISIQIVQPVHDPESGHDPPIELLYQSDLSRISLLMGAGVINGDGSAFLVDHILLLAVEGFLSLETAGVGAVIGHFVVFDMGSHDGVEDLAGTGINGLFNPVDEGRGWRMIVGLEWRQAQDTQGI